MTILANHVGVSLTNCCLVDFVDVTLACEDANLKVIEVVTVADVDAEKRVDKKLILWPNFSLQICTKLSST